MRVAMLLQPSAPESAEPSLSTVTQDIIRRLRARGAEVDVLVPEGESIDLGVFRPQHDLYVLKSKSPLSLALASAAADRGALVLNDPEASALARDKIASTAILAAAGLPVPPSWATGSPHLLADLLSDAPLWLKPPRGSQGEGVRRIVSRRDPSFDRPSLDVYGLPLPVFAQREVPTSGSDLKVYMVGGRVWALLRPFPARTPEEKLGQAIEPPASIATAALECGRALGLEIFGVDFLVSDGMFFVVDLNAFPGFKGASGAPEAIANHLYERAAIGAMVAA
jgi:ribosomal protein S6--L-glutamate ligase